MIDPGSLAKWPNAVNPDGVAVVLFLFFPSISDETQKND